MKNKLLVLCLLTSFVLPLSAKNSSVSKETLNQKVTEIMSSSPQKPEEANMIRKIFMRQFDRKEQLLRQKIQQQQSAGIKRIPFDQLIDSLSIDVLKKGVPFYNLQKYTIAQINDMYYAQMIPPYIEEMGILRENHYPQDMLEDLLDLRDNIIPPAPYAYLLPPDQSLALSLSKTYLLMWVLLETNRTLETEDIE